MIVSTCFNHIIRYNTDLLRILRGISTWVFRNPHLIQRELPLTQTLQGADFPPLRTLGRCWQWVLANSTEGGTENGKASSLALTWRNRCWSPFFRLKCSNLFDNDKMDDDVCVCVFVFSFVVFCWFIDFKGGFGHTWGNIYIYVYLHGERESV